MCIRDRAHRTGLYELNGVQQSLDTYGVTLLKEELIHLRKERIDLIRLLSLLRNES